MNCIEFRRLLFVHPRELTVDQENHALECDVCAKAAAEASARDVRRAQSVFVRVPDALADRVLLGQRERASRPLRYGMWAMAATLLLGVVLGAQLYRSYDAGHDAVSVASALPPGNAAVAAISFVLDQEPRLLKEGRAGDPQVMQAAFRRLGLRQPPDGTTVRYLGKCPVPGGVGDHVVLSTPYGQVTLILVPDYPIGSRVLVGDRQMVALANPAGEGGYIVVADSARTIERVRRMLAS